MGFITACYPLHTNLRRLDLSHNPALTWSGMQPFTHANLLSLHGHMLFEVQAVGIGKSSQAVLSRAITMLHGLMHGKTEVHVL